jgi:hypothetical protein
VRVVLDEVADPQQAVERARELVAVQEAGLAEALGQVAVGPLLEAEQVRVARAVHRLERHRAALGLGHEHVVAVLEPVLRRAPQRGVVELRRLHLV